MPKGGVAECPQPQPKSSPTHEAESLPTSDTCGDQISANANVDICAGPGTIVSQDIEHNIGSGSSGGGGGEHKGGEISNMPPQVTEAIPSGLGEMIPSLSLFSASGPVQ
jgi:hypothetical protein